MRVPLGWLRSFVKYRGGAEALAAQLTAAGTEVERIERPTKLPDSVRVGVVKTLVQHPAADKLTVAKVSLGRGPVRTIVCGAPNIALGQKVAVVLPGTTLPNGMTIEARPVRGVASSGMIASEAELGLGEDGSGILVLDAHARVGELLHDALKRDTVLELEVTPNRADLLSVLGVAREVAALQNLPHPKLPRLLQDHRVRSPVRVTVRDPRGCPQYGARLVRGVTVGPSPRWMVERLRAAGLSAHNVVVDVANYVMLELGEPLHAFDAAHIGRVSGRPSLVIRRSLAGEKLVTLDGAQRKLPAGTLVIADAKHVLAVAGILGGALSAVTERTRDIVLEAAQFDPGAIRATRRKLGILTDAAQRFERGVDPALVEVALDRAAVLLAELAHGTLVPGRALVGVVPQARTVAVDPAWVSALLGVPVSRTAFTASLTRQGAGVEFRNGARGKPALATVTVPTWRHDIGIPAEIADEVGRMLGLAKLKPTHPTGRLESRALPRLTTLRRSAEDLAVAHGATELKLYAFQPPERSGPGELLEVQNPLDPEQRFLRRALHPALEQHARHIARERSVVYVFETGHVFLPKPRGIPNEPTHLAVVRIANEAPAEAYRTVRTLLDAVLRSKAVWSGGAEFHASLEGRTVGWGTLKALERGTVVVAEIDLSAIADLPAQPKRFVPIPPFPPVKRDLAFYLPAKTPYASVEKFLRRSSPLLTAVEAFDYFERDGKRSVAVHCTFQSSERTLTANEVDAIVLTLQQTLTSRFGAQLR